jgi:hypothetical protein
LVHYNIEGENIFVYHIHGREPDPHLVDEILPKFHKLKCLEMSPKKLYTFAGGSSMVQDPRTGATN